MKAAVLKAKQELKVENVPKPELGSDEVLVRVKACGICGSDIRYFMGENPWALHTLGVNKENPANIILGHEFAGELVDVGKNSFLSKHIGKSVVVSPYKACRVCHFCRTGSYHLCADTIHLGHGAGWGKRDYYPGGMAEYCQVWADKVYLLPENISYQTASLLDIAGVGIHALAVANLSPGSDIAIIGVGPLGATLIQTAVIWGARKIFCSDILEAPLALAAETGADFCINIEKENLIDSVLKNTGQRGVSVVVDTVGTTQTQRQGLKILSPGGIMVNMATNTNEVSFKLLELSGERTIKSSSNYFFHEFNMALELASAGKLNLSPLVTDIFSLSEVAKAFETVMNKKENGSMKVVILP